MTWYVNLLRYRSPATQRRQQRNGGGGIRALAVDKDHQPAWNPTRIEDVTATEMVEPFFVSPWAAGAHPLRHLPNQKAATRRQRLHLFMARSTSRLPSRSLIVSRLSCSALPLARAISHLTRPARLSSTG